MSPVEIAGIQNTNYQLSGQWQSSQTTATILSFFRFQNLVITLTSGQQTWGGSMVSLIINLNLMIILLTKIGK